LGKIICQLGILIFGVAAVMLIPCKNERLRRWADIMGWCGIPFWFGAAYLERQWGIFALNFLYAVSWMRGVWNFWIEPAIKARKGDT
jgi:hypothetical protein